MGKWSEQVKLEAALTEVYSWRKYGHKDILGANYPRAYYRCTHRNVQGCLATKQVQRSHEDLSVFELTYRGRHTCIQATQLSKEEIIQESKPMKKICMDHVFSFKANKGVNVSEEGLFPSFSFDSTHFETKKLENI